MLYAIKKIGLKFKRLVGLMSSDEYRDRKKEIGCGKVVLGVAYNLFDGEELLEASIKSIRSEANHIVVIYQTISNAGQLANENLEKFLKELKDRQLIDEIYCYEPDLSKKEKTFNEKRKRDIGLELIKKAGCNYFLSMDTDEFYDPAEIRKSKAFIIKNDIECSAVSIIEYIKEPIYQIVHGHSFAPKGLETRYEFFVPFIMKIFTDREQYHGEEFPCLADPTRGLNASNKFYLFPRHEIVMHHMSTVRKDLDKKYKSSSLQNHKTALYLEEIKNDILSFDFEKNKVWCDNIEYSKWRNLVVKKVDNYFGVNI